MKLAHITPTRLLDKILTPEDRFHLVLSSVLAVDSAYFEFYSRKLAAGDYVIMDSPAFELHGDVDWALHLRMVEKFNPSEVVLPDNVDSAKETVDLSSFGAQMLRRQQYQGKLMAVPHGKDLAEYRWCASKLLAIPGVQVLGIQEEIPELFGISREDAAMLLRLDAADKAGDVQFHYLGFTETMEELLKPPHIIRSADSAKLVVWGLNKQLATPTCASSKALHPYPGRKSLGGTLEYFNYFTASIEAIEAVQANIRAWRNYHETLNLQLEGPWN